jgi:uncharacterized protein (DUF1778 family)
VALLGAEIMMSVTTKQERLEITITAEQKKLFTWVASTYGQTIEEFVISVLETVAEDAIRGPAQAAVRVSPRAYQQLLEMIDNPGELNEHLRAAFERYREEFGE